MTAARRGHGVPCPDCGGGLTVHLEVGVELRLTSDGEDFTLGALHTHVPRIRDRALRQYGDGQRLELDEEGVVVMCRSCDYIGTLTSTGRLETEADRRATHATRVGRSK